MALLAIYYYYYYMPFASAWTSFAVALSRMALSQRMAIYFIWTTPQKCFN